MACALRLEHRERSAEPHLRAPNTNDQQLGRNVPNWGGLRIAFQQKFLSIDKCAVGELAFHIPKGWSCGLWAADTSVL